MNIKLFFYGILFLPTTTNTMLTSFFTKRSPQQTIAYRSIATCKHPRIATVYQATDSATLPTEIKKSIINQWLLYTSNVSDEERKTLHLLRNIVSNKDKINRTMLLSEIVERNDNELLKIGLSYGLNKFINHPDEYNNRPLFIAATRAYPTVVDTLVRFQANVDLCNEMNRTAVIGTVVALLNNNDPNLNEAYIHVLKILQKARATLFAQDDNNNTAHNYIFAALHEQSNQRQRTMHNEQGDELALYQTVAQMLEEWY